MCDCPHEKVVRSGIDYILDSCLAFVRTYTCMCTCIDVHVYRSICIFASFVRPTTSPGRSRGCGPHKVEAKMHMDLYTCTCIQVWGSTRTQSNKFGDRKLHVHIFPSILVLFMVDQTIMKKIAYAIFCFQICYSVCVCCPTLTALYIYMYIAPYWTYTVHVHVARRRLRNELVSMAHLEYNHSCTAF